MLNSSAMADVRDIDHKAVHICITPKHYGVRHKFAFAKAEGLRWLAPLARGGRGRYRTTRTFTTWGQIAKSNKAAIDVQAKEKGPRDHSLSP
jgi:hypothetical protein